MKRKRCNRVLVTVLAVLTLGTHAMAGASKEYTIVAPRGGFYSAAYDSRYKETNTHGYVYLLSSTNGRKVQFRMYATSGSRGTDSDIILPSSGTTLYSGNIVAGQTVGLQAKVPINEGRIFNTTVRGSWQCN